MFRRLLMPAVLAACVMIWSGAASAQVEYVKVCDAFGAGFFYSPGTETCIQSNGGNTRRESPGGGFPISGRTGVAEHLDDARAGAAAAASLPRTFIDTGDAYAVSAGGGGVSRTTSANGRAPEDHTGTGGLGAALRYDEHLTFSGALAGTGGSYTPGAFSTSGSEAAAAAGRGGFNYSW